jgi:glycosyltransferase involved in cell wall biosynthesis
MKEKKLIIVSGINLYRAGSLKIMQNCLAALATYVKNEYKILALVYKQSLYEANPYIEFIEFPKSRYSWLHRIYYEYFYFYKLSMRYKPYCWLSMHDMTPNVVAPLRAVYCHNTSPFYTSSWSDVFLDYHFFLFSFFYNALYRINLKKNTYVIVQQEWLRKEFERIFKINNVLVALPEIKHEIKPVNKPLSVKEKNKEIIFFYPSIPRVYKNFEAICIAARILLRNKISGFQIYLTISQSENKYAKKIYRKYHTVENVHFIGLQSRSRMNYYYELCDCLLFPSKLESWGLPLTEAKEWQKPILSADLPYAKETIGVYDKVKFFNPNDPQELALRMSEFIQGRILFEQTHIIEYKQPWVNTWNGLFDVLLKNKNA